MESRAHPDLASTNLDHTCMSLYHITVAEQLILHSQKLPYPERLSYIRCAITALDLYIESTSAKHEVYARIRLAELLLQYTSDYTRAESVLVKASIKIGQKEEHIYQKLYINELLSGVLRKSGSVKAAKQVIKDSISICKDLGSVVDAWHYTFLFRAYECDPSITRIKAIRGLAVERGNLDMLKLADSYDLSLAITQSSQISITVCEEPVSALDLLLLTLSVLYDAIQGNTTPSEAGSGALAKLTKIQKLLDTDSKISMDVQVEVADSRSLKFQSFSSKQFTIFIYFLSAIVHMADVASTRGEKFLMEGLRQLYSGSNTQSKSWNALMEGNLRYYLCLSHLLHSRYQLAQAELKWLTEAKWDEGSLNYLRGCLCQSNGELTSALSFYENLPNHLRVYGAINSCLIYHKTDRAMFNRTMGELESVCTAGPPHTAFLLLSSLADDCTSVNAKRILSEVVDATKIQANTQFNMLALTILSVKSSDPDNIRAGFAAYAAGQASRSSTGSKTTGTSDSANIWSHFHAQTLEEVLERRGEKEKSQKAKELNDRVRMSLQTDLPVVYNVITSHE